MTSTNDGKEVKSNQTSGTKGKIYYIELYKSLEARLSETVDANERTKHLCDAWRSVHSLCQHSATSTHTHLLNWVQRHTARTFLQTSWQKPEREGDRKSLEAAIDDFITTATSDSGGQTQWEAALVSRGQWLKRVLAAPWQHPVLTSLLNASGSPPTDDEVLTWLKEERGVTFVARLHTLVAEKCDDIAVSLATAVMDRVRAALPPIDDADEQGPPPAEEQAPNFGDKLKEEAGFTKDVWESITDIELVLLHKRDSKQCIALAKQFPLMDAYPMIERLQKRLEAAPREKRLWKNAKDVATLIAQVVIARCMVVKTCQGAVLTALYCCARLLAGLLTSRLSKTCDALAAQAPTARHLHTMAAAVDKQLSSTHVDMKPYVCELYVRAITAGMNELEKLKLKTEKETEARTMERTLASWFVQLGSVLNKSDRIACECTLTAFSLHPSQRMFERIESAPHLAPVLTDSTDTKDEPITSEFGSWANDSRSQTNLVKTSETLNLKQTLNQTNVLSTAILNEGEALGLSTMLCQDIAVLLAGPRVKTLSWDMDRSLLLENCRAYMEKTHGGTRVPTRELKYLNIDLKQYQHLPEEKDDDENDPYYGIERGYEHLAVFEEPENIWADVDPEKTESVSSIEDYYLEPRRKKKSKRNRLDTSSEEDSDPLSMVAEAKRIQKKKERPHSKERSKERAKKKQEPVDPLGPESEKTDKPAKEKKERKKKEKVPKVIGGKRSSLAKLLGIKVEKPKKIHKDFPLRAPVTDSDYDSQGKGSLAAPNSGLGSREDLRKKEAQKNRSSFTITSSKTSQSQRPPFLSKMQYRPQYPNAPRLQVPDIPPLDRTGYTNFKHYHDETKANLSRLLEERRKKELEKKQEAQNKATTPRPPAILRPNISSLQSHISPKAVAIPEIPKSYISKEQAEQYAEMIRGQKAKSSVIQYARNPTANTTVPSTSESQNKSTAQANTIPLKMADIVNTSYDRLMAEIAERQSKSQEAKPAPAQHQPPPSPMPAHRSYSVMTSGQRDFQNFLQNYDRKSVMAHPDDFKPIKKPMPVSRVVPVVPSVPKADPKPAQCAKQPIQLKKPEPTLNTFSRLSYMHKNKQNEMKSKAPQQKPTCETSTYQEVSTELDEIIKEHQRAQKNVIQAKRDKELWLKQSLETVPKCDSKTHPLLCDLLANKSNSDQLTNRRDNIYGNKQILGALAKQNAVQTAAPAKSHSLSTASKNTTLSEKDQIDLWSLLQQQQKLNSVPQHSSNVHSKPSTSIAIKPQMMSQYNSVGQNRQQFYLQNKPSDSEERCVTNTLENKIINVLSNTLQKPGPHEVNKSLSVNIRPPSRNDTSDKLVNTIASQVSTQDKVNKNSSSKVIVEKLPEPNKPEWQSVMQDILKLKTPSREPQIIEVPFRKSYYESPFDSRLKRPTLLPTQPKLEKDMSIKSQDKVVRPKPVITSIQNVIITKKGVNVQDAPQPQKDVQPKTTKPPELVTRSTNETSKKAPQEAQRKPFTYAGPKHDDPFISGIPNSDYDLLEELMDDDLRKEIGELSSDEDNYNAAAQSFLRPTKHGENKRVSVQFNKCINEASLAKPKPTDNCQSSNETPPCTVQPISQCASKTTPVLHGNSHQQKAFSVESILASQNAPSRIPPSTSNANPAYSSNVQNVKNTLLVNPNNSYMTAVPQQAPSQKVVLVGSNVVYGGYSTVQAVQSVTNLTSNYVAVSNTPMVLYQTQYVSPVAIEAAVPMPVLNNVSVISVQQNMQNNIAQNSYTEMKLNNEPQTSTADTHMNVNKVNETNNSDTSNLNRLSSNSHQNHKSQDEIKSSERKVLSEVQDFVTTEKLNNTRNQIVENDIVESDKKDVPADKERLKKKRLAILNREIYHRCGEKTIPLTYSPIPKTETVLRQDTTENTIDKESENLSHEEGEKLIEQIKNGLQDLSEAINEVSSPATPDSIECKENKSTPATTCRRILLRSSNKMTPIRSDIIETPVHKKSKSKAKADNSDLRTKDKNEVQKASTKSKRTKLTQAEKTETTSAKVKEKTTDMEKQDITPTRVSNRIRNKKIEKAAKEHKQQNEAGKSTTEEVSTASNGEIVSQAESPTLDYFDIEAELQGTVISKSDAIMKRCTAAENEITMATTLTTTERQEDISDINLNKVQEQNEQVDALSLPESNALNTTDENVLQQTMDGNSNSKPCTDEAEHKTTDYETGITINSPSINQLHDNKNKINILSETTDDKLETDISANGSKSNTCCHKTDDDSDSNLSPTTQEKITKDTSQICNEISTALDENEATYDRNSIIQSKTDKKDNCNIATKKQTIIGAIKENVNNDRTKSDEDINISETIPGELERTTLQKDNIDLDMSVTCDESASKSSPTLGNVITARRKPINFAQKKDICAIETRSKSILTEVSAGGQPAPENISVKTTSVPHPQTSNTEKNTSREETSHKTCASTNEDDDVVIIDNSKTKEVVKNNKIQTSMLINNATIVNHEQTEKRPHEKLPNLITAIETMPERHSSNKSTGNVLSSRKSTVHKDISANIFRAPIDNADEMKDIKEKICIEELSVHKDGKKIRVTLPNGRKFKATVHGNINLTYDALFAFPSIRNALINGLECKKLIATVDLNNPEKILSAQVLNVQNHPVKSNVVETIDLLSDEEDSSPAKDQTKVINKDKFVIDTELGKLKIPPMDKDLFMKHKEQLKKKAHVLLYKVDVMMAQKNHHSMNSSTEARLSDTVASTPKNTCKLDPKTQCSARIDSTCMKPLRSARTDKSPIIPNEYLTGLLNDIENKLAEVKDTSKVIPEVVEIDDSSNDSIDLQKTVETKPENKNIDLLKNELLKELGVESRNPCIDEDVKIIEEDVKVIEESEVVKIVSPAKKGCRRKLLKLSMLATGKSYRLSDLDEEEQQLIKRRKCTLKLIRCDDLAILHEKEIADAEKLDNSMPNKSVVINEELSLHDLIDVADPKKLDNSNADNTVTITEECFVLDSIDDAEAEKKLDNSNAEETVTVTEECSVLDSIDDAEVVKKFDNSVSNETAKISEEPPILDCINVVETENKLNNYVSDETAMITEELPLLGSIDVAEAEKKLDNSVSDENVMITDGSYIHGSMDIAGVEKKLDNSNRDETVIITEERHVIDSIDFSEANKKLDDSMPNETVMITEEYSVLDSIYDNCSEERASSPVIELFDVFASLNAKIPECDTQETPTLTCQANRLITKPEVDDLCNNDDVVITNIDQENQYNSSEVLSLRCDANWLSTKSTTHSLAVDSSLICANVSMERDILDFSMIASIPSNCKANWHNTKTSLRLQENGDTGVRLNVFEHDQKMRDLDAAVKTMPLIRRASRLTVNPRLRLQMDRTSLLHTNLLDNHVENCDAPLLIPLSCESNWHATKPRTHSRQNVVDLNLDAKEYAVMTLTCKAEWLNTKPTIHTQGVQFIISNARITCNGNSDNSTLKMIPLVCKSHWLTTKAELQLVEIIKRKKDETFIKTNHAEIMSLSCKAKWLATKANLHLEELDKVVSENLKSASTMQLHINDVPSLVSKALTILQNANIINQYRLLQELMTHPDGISLKRRLPPIKMLPISKIRKLNNKIILGTTSSDVIKVSESNLDSLTVVSPAVNKSSSRISCAGPKVNLNEDNSDLLHRQHEILHIVPLSPAESQEQISINISGDKNKKALIDRKENDDSIFSKNTHVTHIEKETESKDVSDYCDDIEATLAAIVGEPLSSDRRKIKIPVVVNNPATDVKNINLAKEQVTITKRKNDEKRVKLINHVFNDAQESLSKTVNKLQIDNNSLEDADLLEVEVIDDWKSEVVDKSLANNGEKYAEVKSIDDQVNINQIEPKPNNMINTEIYTEDSIENSDHIYCNPGVQPIYKNNNDHVVTYVPTENILMLSGSELEEEIVDMSSGEIIDDFDFSKHNHQNTSSQVTDEMYKQIPFDDIEIKLAEICGEPLPGNVQDEIKDIPLTRNSSPLPDAAVQFEENKQKELIYTIKNKISNETNIDIDTKALVLKKPKRTYAKCASQIFTRRKSLKRRVDMSDTKTCERKYRKGKNIDYPKFTAQSMSETVYIKEYTRIMDYCSSVKFSYSMPFHKEIIDVNAQHKSWPILKTLSKVGESQEGPNDVLFTEIEECEALVDPLKQTFVEEMNSEFDENSYTPSKAQETNFSMGFGERSGRVLQESIDGEYTTFSAATLSDVKQLQPLLPSDVKETRLLSTSADNNLDQKMKAKQFVDRLNLREKVRAFFEKSKAELDLDLKQTQKKYNCESDDEISSWPFADLTSTRFFRPAPLDITVNVVQVGQLPVSAAAQNPVTCDPRVTHVSNASPSQCSPDNSIGDELQTRIKTEYTELTTANLTVPMIQEYVTQHHSMPSESQEPSNVYSANSSSDPSDMKSVVKIELMEDTSQDHDDNNVNYEDNGLQQLPNGNINTNMQYQFDTTNNIATEPSGNTQPVANPSTITKAGETYSENKELSDAAVKSDQLVHAMSAAGIPATKSNTNIVETMPQNHQPNVTISQANTNNFPRTTPINALALQQALAQILPPSLNQGNSTSDSNQHTTGNPQVLHIVQGNNSQSVINKPNGTQLLHIVQNKNAVNNNASPSPKQTTFSGLSLVDGALQQGGNQLLHIVNANQKNANAGQLLKRVNLLTNLANVQGTNEQKMLQFVCKSADGKPIQLPHQRSMVLRLQPLDPANVPATPKQNENQDLTSTSSTSHPVKEKETSPQEMKSRSLYEENYAKFVQNDTKLAQNGDQKQGQEKATSLPKFNQVFGKQVYQDKQDELETDNMPQNPDPPEENNPPLEHMNDMNNPQMLIRKPNQTQPTHVQPNLVQQIKQSIGPMNIQTMHGGVIYTRQIPVNIGNGQTINLITVPSTELVDDSGQKQQADGKFGNQEGDPPIIKIVPTNQPTSANGSSDENNGQLKTNNEGNSQPNPQPQPQPVLTQMRIKLPMLSKAPQMVGGTRVVRPSFFQIQRNVIGGANQQVYQQLVLTAAPPIGQSIRLPAQVQKPKIPSETQSSPESQMSSSTLEQLREFDMVLEQVKERSTVQPGSSAGINNFSKLKSSPDTTDAPTPSTSIQESPTQVLYSVGNTQSINMVNYVTRKSTITSTTTTSFVRSPDSTGTVESPSSSTHSHLPHTVASDSCASSCASEAAATTVSQPKPKKKKPKPSTSNSNPFNIKNTPKPSSQKPLEDEQTTQRILYILAEYKEQVENSPDKDKPAPRRRNNPAAPNAGSSKRKKSSSGSRRRDMSPVLGEDSCRTMGSEDSSCGTSLGECNECLETHSPEESPKKVVRRLTFEQETQITQTRTTTTTTTVPQRNVIVTDGQAFAVRGAPGKPATTVLMPANYLLPVSMVKGGQQIAIVTNRGPKLLVGAGEGGTGGTLLFQRLIGPGGLKPVIARPGVRHIRLPTAALHNLQTFNIATTSTAPPPDSTASPAPAPTPPDLVDTRAMSSPWPDRDAGEVKPERGNSSPEGSEPWNLPSSSIADDYGYEEIVRTDNMDRTVLDALPDRYSPDLEAQRIFDKMFDSDSKKSMCGYDIDASDDDKAYHQVVHRKDGRHTTRLTHVSSAALRHKYAILEHELRLQKSLSEECEDLGVDSPSASELFPEAELLFAPSPAHEQTIDHCHTPQPTIHTQAIPQPDLDDQIATDQLLTHKNQSDDLDINLDDVGEIVTVGEDGMTTIPLDHEEFARSHEEFARSHPNTTFHSEPEDGEVPPFTIAQGAKGRQITFHSRGVPVVMAPQTTVISQATVEAAGQSSVKFSDIDNMINSMPSPQHAHNLKMPSVLVKHGNESLTKFDRLLNEPRDMSSNMTSNPASAIVHSTGNGTQVIRRVQYDNRRDSRYLVQDSDAMLGGDTKMTEERRDLHMDDNSSSERHPELFWEQSKSERKRFDFSSDSDKCCKSPYDETNSDSSGVSAHTRLDSVIKAARPERRRSDGSSAEESHPPLRTYPAKRTHQHAHHSHHHSDVDRSLTGKTRAPDRCHDVKDESRRRASNRGVVKRGCHCCNGSSAAPKPKKSRPKKSNEFPHN